MYCYESVLQQIDVFFYIGSLLEVSQKYAFRTKVAKAGTDTTNTCKFANGLFTVEPNDNILQVHKFTSVLLNRRRLWKGQTNTEGNGHQRHHARGWILTFWEMAQWKAAVRGPSLKNVNSSNPSLPHPTKNGGASTSFFRLPNNRLSTNMFKVKVMRVIVKLLLLHHVQVFFLNSIQLGFGCRCVGGAV